MKKLQPLQTGNHVGIISPAGRIESKYISNAIKHLEGWGLKTITGKHTDSYHNQFAGSDTERAEDFISMLQNDDVKAIFCSRGGYGSVRTLEQLDLSVLNDHPKWLIGYSDITVFHQYYNNMLKLPTIHGSMPKNFPVFPDKDASLSKLQEVLFGELPEYLFPSSNINRPGISQGILIGGNLSILYSLRGTQYDYDFSNKILFIEDVGEYLYHLDRIMMNFKTGDKFKNLKGIIIGGFSQMKDNDIPYGKNANHIILDYVKDLNIPVCFDFPAGHIKNNMPLILGNEIILEVGKTQSVIKFL